jgi:hypothetical protein
MKREYVTLGVIAIVVIFLALRAPAPHPTGKMGVGTRSPEITRILNLRSVSEREPVLQKLLERVGPDQAQEELLRSGLPFTGETHLLVHTIGNYVYEKYGADGLSHCRDYFLSACYHAFILNTLADHGMGGMVDVMKHCEEAGPGVPAQCAHGAGHGFVAWQDYNLTEALEMCDELGSKSFNFQHFNCYDGVFMENFWGVHEGKPSPKRWVSTTDIYYPCTDPRISEKYLKGCWSNQATSIYQHFKGDLSKTAQACDAVENELYRNTCYDNWSRQINPLTKGDVRKTLSLCGLATGSTHQTECVLINMSAFWAVGDRQTPYDLCSAMPSDTQPSCWQKLSGTINYYYRGKAEERELYCDKITDATYREKCKKF